MATSAPKNWPGGINFLSSLKDDVWHPDTDSRSDQVWHFDALSDDGTEAVAIRFHDNLLGPGRNDPAADIERIPAVSFLYYRSGKVVCRGTSEGGAGAFVSSDAEPMFTIGESGFDFSRAEYGSGFLVKVKMHLSGRRSLDAHFEWLSIEADLSADTGPGTGKSHSWNLVAPRSDVTGKITLFDSSGTTADVRHFRGTGHHSHIFDGRPNVEITKLWHWGRVHYSDATAAFSLYRDSPLSELHARTILVRDGQMLVSPAEYTELGSTVHKFGIRYPNSFRIESEDAVIDVTPRSLIDGAFHGLRFLSDISLSVNSEDSRSRPGLTELITHTSERSRWSEWLGRLRTGRDERTSTFS